MPDTSTEKLIGALADMAVCPPGERDRRGCPRANLCPRGQRTYCWLAWAETGNSPDSSASEELDAALAALKRLLGIEDDQEGRAGQ